MKIEKKNNLIPIVLALIVMLLWGSLYPSVKLAYKMFEIDTSYYPNLLLFAGIRFTTTGLLISLFQTAKKKSIPVMQTKTEWLGVLLVGVFAVIINYACTFFGLAVVESSKTALLKQSGMLIFIVVSVLFFKEDKLTWQKGIGAILGLASIILLNLNELGISFSLGSIIIIVSSFSSVTSSVVCKKILKDVDSVALTGYSQLFGGVVLFVIGFACGGSITLQGIGDFALFSYILAATCVSYALWYTVVQKYELSKLFIIKLSEPMFAAVISAIVLQENLLQIPYLFAFLCIASAVVISNVNFGKKSKQ